MPAKKSRYFSITLITALFCLWGSFGTQAVEFGNPPQQVYTLEETSLTEFWCGIRLNDGRMLFAGEGDCLSIYDGWNWTNFEIPKLRIVHSLAKGNGTRIWVGSTQEFGYLEFVEGDFSYTSIPKKLGIEESEIETIYSILQMDESVLFFGETKVYVYKDEQLEIHKELSTSRRISPFSSKDGVYCLAEGNLYKWAKNRFELKKQDYTDVGKQIVLAWSQSDQEVVLTDEGFENFGTESIDKISSFDALDLANFTPSNALKINNRIFVPSRNSGLVIFDSKNYRYQQIIPNHFIPIDSFESIAVEDENFIWLINRSNLVRIDVSRSASLIHYTLSDPYFELWDSTSVDHKFYFSNKDGIHEMDTSDDTRRVTQIFDKIVYGFTPFGNLFYLSTPWYFVSLDLDTGEEERIIDPLISISSKVVSKDELWVTSTYDVRNLKRTDGEWRESEPLTGFTGAATQIETDAEGGHWVATNTGNVVRFSNENLLEVEYPEISETLEKDGFDSVGLFSIDNSVFLVSPNWIFQWVTQNRFEPVLLNDLMEDSLNWEWKVPLHFPTDSNIWMIRKHKNYGGYEIGKFTLNENGKPVWNNIPIPNQDLLGPIRKVHEFTDAEGNDIVAVTGADGITFLNLERLPPVQAPAIPRLSFEFEAPGKTYTRDHLPAFKEGKEIVPSFHFYTPHFRKNEPMFFETRLVGLEENWNPPFQQTSRSFPGLRSGRYDFEVRTVNCLGEVSKSATLSFHVLPPWYRTTVAFVVYAITLLYIGFMAFNMRLRATKRRAEELKKEVDRQTEELIVANRVKSDFVANMSHEFRNPVNGIIGNVKLLTPGQPVEEKTQQSLSHSSAYLKRLVENILDFSKIESGKLTIHKGWFNPVGLRSTVKLLFENMAKKANISLIVAYYGPEDSEIFTDQSRIEQVLVNLTSNAIRFTKSGSVRIAIHLQPSGNSTAKLRLWVQDTGAGIKKEDQDRIFKAFEQGPSLSHMGAGEKGTGLGLAIVDDIIQRLDGTKVFESEYGVGTRFDIRFETKIRKTEDVDSDPESDNATTQITGRYLLVDDYEDSHSYFSGTIEKWGGVADVVSNGTSAFELLNKHAYNAIFLDWNLPDYSGPEIAKMIRKNTFPLNTNTFIIAQTAYNSEEQRALCMEVGMDEFIVKPLEEAILLKTLMLLNQDLIISINPKDLEGKSTEDPLKRNELIFETAYKYAEIRKHTIVDEVEGEILKRFEKCCELMPVFLVEQNVQLFEEVTHKAIGIVSILSPERTVQYLREMNNAAKARDRVTIDKLMEKLPDELEHFRQLVEAHLTFEREFNADTELIRKP